MLSLCVSGESNPDHEDRNLMCYPLHYRRLHYNSNELQAKIQPKVLRRSVAKTASSNCAYLLNPEQFTIMTFAPCSISEAIGL